MKLDVELRDEFAAAALTGLLSGPAMDGWAKTCQGRTGNEARDKLADAAYLLADAMMRRRKVYEPR